MTFSKAGFAHTVVFVLVIVFGFGVALAWPQFAKHREISRAKDALFSAARLAEVQRNYAKEHGGEYAADWLAFGLPLTCPQVTKDGVNVLECEHYDFFVQDGQIVARHKNFAKWFTYDITTGKADCSHEEDSVAGAHICDRVAL